MKLLKTADEGAYCLQAAGLDLVSRAHDRLRGILKNEAIDFDGAAKDAACFDLLKTRVEKSEDGEKLKVSSQSVALVSSSWLVPDKAAVGGLSVEARRLFDAEAERSDDRVSAVWILAGE